VFSGGAMGGSIASLVARALGAGQVARAEALVVHALGIAVVAGLATTVGMLALSHAVFSLLGGRGEPLARVGHGRQVVHDVEQYLRQVVGLGEQHDVEPLHRLTLAEHAVEEPLQELAILSRH